MTMEPTAMPEPPPMSEFDRLFGVLFDPQPAFQDMAKWQRVRWWVPILLLTALSLTITHFYGQRVGWERLLRQQLESNERFQQIPAERREEIIRGQVAFAAKWAYLGSALAWLLITVVVAGAYLFVFNVLMGSDLTFGAMYGVTCYAMLPHFVAGLIALALLFVKDPADFDLQNPVASNLAVFLDPNSTAKWVQALAGSFDLFAFWVLALLATGFAAVGRRLPWTKALTWVTGAWVFYVAVKTTWVWVWS